MGIEAPGYTPGESEALTRVQQGIEQPEGMYTPEAESYDGLLGEIYITDNFLEAMIGPDGTTGYVGEYIKSIKDAVNFESLETNNSQAFAGKIRTSVETLETNIKNEIDAYAKAIQDAIVEIAGSLPQAMQAAQSATAQEVNVDIDPGSASAPDTQ